MSWKCKVFGHKFSRRSGFDDALCVRCRYEIKGWTFPGPQLTEGMMRGGYKPHPLTHPIKAPPAPSLKKPCVGLRANISVDESGQMWLDVVSYEPDFKVITPVRCRVNLGDLDEILARKAEEEIND